MDTFNNPIIFYRIIIKLTGKQDRKRSQMSLISRTGSNSGPDSIFNSDLLAIEH